LIIIGIGNRIHGTAKFIRIHNNSGDQRRPVGIYGNNLIWEITLNNATIDDYITSFITNRNRIRCIELNGDGSVLYVDISTPVMISDPDDIVSFTKDGNIPLRISIPTLPPNAPIPDP
jgi:hypothetical protein